MLRSRLRTRLGSEPSLAPKRHGSTATQISHCLGCSQDSVELGAELLLRLGSGSLAMSNLVVHSVHIAIRGFEPERANAGPRVSRECLCVRRRALSFQRRGAMEPTAEFYFNLADREKKGFIVKRDMQRLLESESEVSFSPPQLESVFELMDKRGRGYVTLEEFTVIFENFCGLEAKQGLDSKSECRRLLQSIKDTNVIPRALPELEKITDCLLDSQFSAFTNVYQDVWERFLSILHQDLTLRLEQEEILERNMKLKERDSFNYVQSMMDEMESQIQTERKKIAEEEQRKAQKATARLANELEEKERRLQLIGIKEHELKSQIAVIKGKNSSLSNLNEKLLRQKEQLEEEIAEERKRTEELLGQVGEYKQKLDEKRSEDQEINQIYHVNLPPLHSKLLLQAKGLAEQLRMLFALEAFLLSDKR